MSRRNRAFSLIELMVYMGILGVFLTGLYAAFSLGVRCIKSSEARSDAAASMQLSCTLIERLLAGASFSTVNTTTRTASDGSGRVTTDLLFLSAQSSTAPVFQSDSAGNLWYEQWVCFWVDMTTNQFMVSAQRLPAASRPTTSLSPTGTNTSSAPITPVTVGPLGAVPWPNSSASIGAAFTYMEGANVPQRLVARGVTNATINFNSATNTVSYLVNTTVNASVASSVGDAAKQTGLLVGNHFVIRN